MTRITATLREDQYKFLTISCSFLHRMLQTNVVEKIKAYISCSITFFSTVEEVTSPFQAFQPKWFCACITSPLFLTWPFHYISVGLVMRLLSAERKELWNCSSCCEASFDYMFLLLSGVNCSQSQFELGSPFSKPAIFIFCSILLLLACG